MNILNEMQYVYLELHILIEYFCSVMSISLKLHQKVLHLILKPWAIPAKLQSDIVYIYIIFKEEKYTGWPNKNGTVDFLGLCSDQQLSFFTLLDKASFPHYNNTKIIKLVENFLFYE